MDYTSQAAQYGRPVSLVEAARANEYFEQFLNATSLKQILGYYRGLIDELHLKPTVVSLFYGKLRASLTSWRAKALWKKFDARAAHKCYQKGKAAAGARVLVIGGGPCGVRTAIEAQLLGAKVVVVEKRDRFSRNNVLHLWPFVIEDLRMLGAKKFFGKFCAGAIDHISIRQLQCILLKVALLLGVEVHTEVGFEKLIEPSAIEKTGWMAEFKPADHPVSHYEFDVIIGADGKRNTLQGFTRKEFRGKLAIAITANFINKRTEAEARVEEISGVAFIFNQKFFKDLFAETGIDLENIVYYKDDTHYFVMTAKKASLLEKGVIKQDLSDTEKLLAPDNVNRTALEQYATEAANFSTNYEMPDLEFAVNHYGQPDIAMFDFTSMYAADNASKVVERNGHRLLMILVGDSLLEPFWPTGSGCARGFLSALDAAWAVRAWGGNGQATPLDVLAERESVYRLLAQTTPDNLNKDWKAYTLDPATRYPNLNRAAVTAAQVAALVDTDDAAAVERWRRAAVAAGGGGERRGEAVKRRRRGTVDNEVLLSWLTEQLKDDSSIKIADINSVFKDGRVLCSIIHHYRPDLLDISSIANDEPVKNNQLAIDILEKEIGISPIMTGADLTNTDDYLAIAGYLTEIYYSFRGEIPHIKHPKLKLPVRITKSFIPPKIKQSIGSHNLKLKPCKKCSDAYNSEIKLHTAEKPEMHKRKLGQERFCSTCTDTLQMQSEEFIEKKVEVTFFNPEMRRKCRKCVVEKRTARKKSIRKGPTKVEVQERESVILALDSNGEPCSRKIHNNSNAPSKPVNNGKEFLKKYADERKEKLRKFMSKLLLKRNKSSSRKCSLSVIPETKIEVETKGADNKIAVQLQEVRVQFESDESPKKQDNDVTENKDIYSTPEKEIVPEREHSIAEEHHTARSNIPATESLVRIQLIEKQTSQKFLLQNIEFISNQLTISSKVELTGDRPTPRKKSKFGPITSRFRSQTRRNLWNAPCSKANDVPVSNRTCHVRPNSQCKFPFKRGMMIDGDGMQSQIYSRVSNWISSNDFLAQDNSKADTEVDTVISNSKGTDITSVSKMDQYDGVKVEERTDVVTFSEHGRSQHGSDERLSALDRPHRSVRTLTKFSQYSPFQHGGNGGGGCALRSSSAPPKQFSVIVEGEEAELPESAKISELSFKTIRTANVQLVGSAPPRPSSRHKRHAEPVPAHKPATADKKTRKRRTLERVGPSGEDRQKTLDDISSNRAERHNRRRQQRKFQTEQFVKSMQMLQANAKADAQPFEDYSIFLYRQTAPKFEDRVKDLEKQFTYIPDHENKSSSQTFRGGGADEDVAAKIKSLENKWMDPAPVEKKPKDLLRAIGKFESTDWNIKEIEKKIQENKLGKPSKAVDKEKVPKWSKEQFLARQTKMEKQHLERQDSAEAKFADVDRVIKILDQKLKEGTVRELGQNKVATITEKLVSKVPAEPKPVEKNTARPPPVLPVQGGSDSCHFCGNRVYIVERLSAEGRFFHHRCFKCQYCNSQLRLGSYAFDKDGLYGNKFFCLQHFGMIAEAPTARVTRKPSVKVPKEKSPEKRPYPGIAGVDLLDKVHTPERIEFANLSAGQTFSDHDDSCQMDEDEWTDKNFGASCPELDDTDDDSSSMSDTDSDDEDAYNDALEEPVTKEGTMKWAERWKNSYSRKKPSADSKGYSSSDQSSYCENSSDDDESDTEGEEEIRARELRKKEVCVEPPIVHTDTGTDTEIVSDETSSDTSSEIQNSATEISTDSEFAQDDPTPTREVPSIVLNDFNVTKTRGSGRNMPKKIQVTTGYLQKPLKGKPRKPHIELKLKPLVPPSLPEKLPAPVSHTRTEGYVLNRTQSTGGIATKVSLELKKKYLLGEDASGSIQKSGSASTLDTKFKSFQTNISDCQKMLKSSAQALQNPLNDRNSPVVLSPQPTVILSKEATKEPSSVPETEFENESEGRPRSPLHETSIIVPQIDWSKKDQALSSDSLASSNSDDEAGAKRVHNIPRVEVHPVQEEEFAPDSLCADSTASPKPMGGEKKVLNQPKTLPNLENLLPEIHNSLHNKYKALEKKTVAELAMPESKSLSGLSSPESEQATTALTETELSDWARDEVVSDDFGDGDFGASEDLPKAKGQLATMAESEDVRMTGELKDKTIITEAMNNILSGNLDIEFMDTGSETSSEDGIGDSQRGYVLLNEDSPNPTVNEVLEATNIFVGKRCAEQIMAAPPANVEQADRVGFRKPNDRCDDDGALNVEAGTTTEENTCSDSTVKNVTEISLDKRYITEQNELSKKAYLNIVGKPSEMRVEEKQPVDTNEEFEEHCQRLQSRVEFSNVKDSIDVRKSRRKSKPDLIQGDSVQTPTPPGKGVTLTLTPTTHTPDILYNKETLKKERDTNQRLIQEMVMNKMKAENKSLEKKKRRSTALGHTPTRDLVKSATADLMSKSNNSSNFSTPDVLLSTNYPLKNSKSVNISPIAQPEKLKISTPNDSKSIFDNNIANLDGSTPKPPPRQNRSSDDISRKLEKLTNIVRSSLEQENVEPNVNLKTPVAKTDKRGSWLHSNVTPKKEATPVRRRQSGNYELAAPAFNNPFSSRTKSTPDFPQKFSQTPQMSYEEETMKIFKSDPNIPDVGDASVKKNKDPERRKSISKILSTLFSKKSPHSSASKGFFSKLSPKMKEISKDSAATESMRKKSLSESFIYRTVTPPPVPPLPLNYEVKKTDESSDGEQDCRKHDLSSCDTLDQTDVLERSTISLNEKRSSKSRRASRQTQYKRHRMAQEIQRKLEETEVKIKEIERRGVAVEMALRGEDVGEGTGTGKEDSDLMQEWFDLMRDKSELERYERELAVRAKELELEDRHARLQHELRERIEDSKPKTEDDLKLERSIINEMIEIVEKRDSLIAEIEEDRIKCSNEDRDREEQMLAKGLKLTPLKNSSEK